jgi:hypothetical protein
LKSEDLSFSGCHLNHNNFWQKAEVFLLHYLAVLRSSKVLISKAFALMRESLAKEKKYLVVRSILTALPQHSCGKK